MLAGKPFQSCFSWLTLNLEAANTPQRFRLAFTGMGNTKSLFCSLILRLSNIDISCFFLAHLLRKQSSTPCLLEPLRGSCWSGCNTGVGHGFLTVNDLPQVTGSCVVHCHDHCTPSLFFGTCGPGGHSRSCDSCDLLNGQRCMSLSTWTFCSLSMFAKCLIEAEIWKVNKTILGFVNFIGLSGLFWAYK